MNRRSYILLFVLQDFLLSMGTWLLFWYIRKMSIETDLRWAPFEITPWLFTKATLAGLGWIGLYWMAGLYHNPYRRSRLKDFGTYIKYSALGVVIVSLATFLDDPIGHFTKLRLMVLDYFLLQVGIVGLLRAVTGTLLKRLMIRGKLGFNSLIVGCGEVAQDIWQELKEPVRAPGFRIQGYVRLPDCNPNRFFGQLKRLGDIDQLREVVRRRRIEEIVIALDRKDPDRVLNIIRRVEDLNIKLHVVPDMYDVLVGNVKLGNVYGAPLVEVSPRLMPPWQAVAKRLIDIACSVVALILLAPVMLTIALAVKLDSKGPVFYRQERIGKGGKPFKIIKFRSMRTDAEKGTPRLSQTNDPRITRVGAFLRKSHLDELPQFFNTLVGDMSLVGPRPERQYFIDQIKQRAPEYVHLHKVRPGITSWGQVKYGYASNVDEMVERLKYDLIYIENISLALDLKIIAYTLLRVIEGDGK